MGGRGRGGGGGSSNTVRSVANALGLARYEIQKMVGQQAENRPLYPKVGDPVPMDLSGDAIYIARLKMELDQRIRDSDYFIEEEKEQEIKRYLDKYSIVKREKVNFDMATIPSELNWKKTKNKSKKPAVKKRKLDNDESLNEKLNKLEEKEKGTQGDEEEENKEEEEDESEKSGAEDLENTLSDDDYQEEDNDYISSYFDNGEGYGDAGSDENIDGDEY